jgi:hypothetical protein
VISAITPDDRRMRVRTFSFQPKTSALRIDISMDSKVSWYSATDRGASRACPRHRSEAPRRSSSCLPSLHLLVGSGSVGSIVPGTPAAS